MLHTIAESTNPYTSSIIAYYAMLAPYYPAIFAKNVNQDMAGERKICIRAEFDRPPNLVRDMGICSTRAGSILTSRRIHLEFCRCIYGARM